MYRLSHKGLKRITDAHYAIDARRPRSDERRQIEGSVWRVCLRSGCLGQTGLSGRRGWRTGAYDREPPAYMYRKT